MRRSILQKLFLISIVGFLLVGSGVFAQTKEELETQIADRNSKIRALEAEIAQTQKELDATAKERQTLQSAVKTLDLARQKVTANIKLTQTKIAQKDAEIKELGNDIGTTVVKIDVQHDAIVSSLRDLDREGADKTMAVSVFSGENLGSFFANASALIAVRNALQSHVTELVSLKDELVTTKTAAEVKRKELAVLKADLTAEQRVLDANRKEKNDLLATTKNKESNYQALLLQKQALHDQFEADLRDFENKLNLIIDPSSIPRYGSGVLSWPVLKPFITQYFGNTEFSTQNPQIYSGNGHNGIDLRASPGTVIMAAKSGVVKGTGDTDATCPNASYGKWILIEHDNGLSTLYAHLSYIRVTKGQNVGTGETIGYSGNTGYSTGPHLHFTVYATQGVQIREFPSKASACKGRVYIMPVADIKAYLNPLSYL